MEAFSIGIVRLAIPLAAGLLTFCAVATVVNGLRRAPKSPEPHPPKMVSCKEVHGIQRACVPSECLPLLGGFCHVATSGHPRCMKQLQSCDSREAVDPALHLIRFRPQGVISCVLCSYGGGRKASASREPWLCREGRCLKAERGTTVLATTESAACRSMAVSVTCGTAAGYLHRCRS